MLGTLRPLVGRLRWIRQYPAYREAPAKFAARTVLYTLRERMAAAGPVEFRACGGRLFASPPNNVSTFIAAVFGQRDLNVFRFWQKTLKLGSVFLDVGANIGLYAVPASARVGPTGRVVCFEAHPGIYRFLCRNVARNCIANVVPENLAVGPESGTLRMSFNPINPGETRVALPGEEGEAATVISLDDYCAEHAIGRVDYMKIDVEGYEGGVLRGAERIIAASPEILIQTEYEPAHLGRYGDPNGIATVLGGWGFAPYSLAWTTGTPRPIPALDGYRGEILWSRRELPAR